MPEIRSLPPSSVCSIGMLPWLMTGYLRDHLTKHFGSEQTIEQPDLRTLLWNATLADRKIHIESITEWSPQNTEHRPAIIIARGDCSSARWGISDRMQGSQPWSGAKHYGCGLAGSHTLFCISSVPLEAEILGAEVARDLLHFADLIREELRLMRFQMAGIGKLVEIEEAHESFAVPVTVAYTGEEKWVLHPQAPLLKRISLSTYLP
jgi:hypothetical protein